MLADAPMTQRQVGADGQLSLYAGSDLMARIRTIKPDFWQHPKTGEVSRDARLLFIGLLNEADDEGRMRYSAKRLSGVLFPFDDDVTPARLDRWITELQSAQLILRYDVDSAAYLEVCGFTEHQRVNRPTPSVLPPPPDGVLTDDSVRTHGAITEAARGEVERELEVEREGNREVAPSAPRVSPPADRVFDAWKAACGKNGATVFSPKRRRVVEAALKSYPIEDLIDAVGGWKQSPFHSGVNDDRKVWNDLELLLRDAQHIEQFRDLARGTGPVGRTPDPVMDHIQRQREMEGRA